MTRPRWKKVVGGACALALLGVIVEAVRSGTGTAPEPRDVEAARREVAPPPPPPDVRAPIAPQGVVVAPGVVEPAAPELSVGAPLPALVRELHVKEGGHVASGAPLVRLDDRVERAAAAAARAEARAAEARAQLSRRIAERTSALAAKEVATPDQLDRAQLQAAIDEAEADARREAAQEAQVRVERLTVRAPTAGTVLRVDVRAGEHWDPEGGPLLVLGDLSSVRVRVEVDERDVARVHMGQAGYVTADAHGERCFPGKVVEIGRRMGGKRIRTDDPTERLDTRVLEVVMQLEHGRELVPGQRVTGYLDGREHRASR